MTPYFLEINHPGINLENKEKIALIFKAINSLPESKKVTFRTSDFPNGIYHYHVTNEDPYLNGNGFFGTAGSITR